MLAVRLRHASVIFVVSDYLTSEAINEIPELRLLTASHDVVAVVIQDPAELELFRGAGEVRVKDPESGFLRRLAITRRTRRRYGAEWRFKMYGLAAIGLGLAFLALLFYKIATVAYPAFTEYVVELDVAFEHIFAASGAAWDPILDDRPRHEAAPEVFPSC